MQQRQWLFVLLAMVALSALGNFLRPVDTGQTVTPDQAEIFVFDGAQSADGFTQDDMDIDFLENLAKHTEVRLSLHMKESFNSYGLTDFSTDFSSEAVYVVIDGVKLAVVRLESDQAYAVEIVGIVGSELRKVLCTRAQPQRIRVASGPCGERMRRVFGIELIASN